MRYFSFLLLLLFFGAFLFSANAQPPKKAAKLSAKSYYSRAIKEIGNGFYESAISDLNRAIRLNPNFEEAYERRIFCYLKAYYYRIEEYEETIKKDLSRLIRLNPRNILAYLHLATFRESKNDIEAMDAAYIKAISISPDDSRIYIHRAEYYEEADEIALAYKDAEKVVSLIPGRPDAYILRGYLNRLIGKLEEAEADYSKAVNLAPKDSDVYIDRAYFKENIGDFQSAESDFTKAIEQNPKIGRHYYARGSFFERRGDGAKSESDFKKAAKFGYVVFRISGNGLRLPFEPLIAFMHIDTQGVFLDEEEPGYVPTLFETKHSAVAFSYGNLLKRCSDIVNLNSENIVAQIKCGKYNTILDQYDQAITHYGEALNKMLRADKPAFEMEADACLNGRAIAYAKKGEMKAAFSDFEEAMRLYPKEARLYFNRAFAFFSLGKDEDALGDLSLAIGLDPEMITAYRLRAKIFRKLGRAEEAMADEKSALSLEKNYTKY